MFKKPEMHRGFLLVGILLSVLTASFSHARLTEDDETGYLSKGRYDLSSKTSNSSRIEIVEDLDAPEKVFGLDFEFKTRGANTQDGNVQSTISVTYIGVEFDWNFTRSLKAQFVGGYQFANGNSAILYGTEGTPYTGPSFDEGSVTYIPMKNIELSAGVVTTEFVPFSSTFSGGGFTGFRQVLTLESGAFVGSIKGYQVQASSIRAANRALDDEKNPALMVANINAGVKYDRFKANIGYANYAFSGMTAASAGDSRYLGNTVIGDGNNIVNYKYKFAGQEIGANAELTVRLDDKIGLSGHLTKNEEAPSKRNMGWATKASYEYNFGRYSIKPSITRFRFESDLMPAFFSQGGLGYLNRDGYAGEIRGTLKKYKLDGFVRYLDAKEVEPKAAQSDRIGVTVGMEVKYEIL